MMYQALGGGKGKNIYMGKVFPTIFYTMKYDCKKLSQVTPKRYFCLGLEKEE